MNPEERKQILSGKGRKVGRRGKKGRPSGKEERPELTLQEHVISWAKTILGALVIVMVVNGLFIQSFVVPTGSMENEVLAGDFVFVNRFIYGGSSPQTIPFINVPLPYFRLPGIRDPEKNDVIVFIFPGNRDEVEPAEFQYYLKRCVAVAGDTLEVRGGYAYVNGVKETFPPEGKLDENRQPQLRDEYRTFPRMRRYTRDNWGPMRIPKEGDIVPLYADSLEMWRVFIEREGHTVQSDGRVIRIDGEIADSYTVERDYVFGMGDNRNDSQDSRYFGFVPKENVVGTPLIVYWSWDPYEDNLRTADHKPVEKSLFGKLGSIRWNRIFSGID